MFSWSLPAKKPFDALIHDEAFDTKKQGQQHDLSEFPCDETPHSACEVPDHTPIPEGACGHHDGVEERHIACRLIPRINSRIEGVSRL